MSFFNLLHTYRICIATAVVAMLLTGTASAINIWVSPSGSDDTGSGTQAGPLATITKAVQIANTGDEIIAKSGVYSGPGNRSISFSGKTITIRSESGPFNTTIDCGGFQAFLAVSGETSSTTVEGFKIINGNVSTGQDWGGDGIIRIYDNGSAESALTVRSCIFTANTVTATHVTSTAGIIIKNGSSKKAVVENCLFYGNTLNGGGWAGSSGGGAGVICFPAINHGAFDITNCTIAHNTLTGSGKIIPCNIVDGSVTNCITWGNSDPHYPFTIANNKATIVTDYGSISYSMATGGVLINAGSGVLIDVDPMFTNTSAGDYSLLPDSPAINTGDPGSAPNPDGSRANIGFRPLLAMRSPVITAQPQSATVYETYPATFSVSATGTGILHYHWRRGTTNILAATNSTYTISSAKLSDGASYNVLVTDDLGTVQSDAVTLTVVSRAPNASVSPASRVVNPGVGVTFTVNVVTGISPFVFQWRKNGKPIPAATTASYTIPNPQQLHEGGYDCVVSNAFGSMTTLAASLVVNDPVVISAHPLSQAANAGDEVRLYAAASGSGPLSYQWRRNSVILDGETAQDLIFTSSSLSSGMYDVVVTNMVGSAISLPARITVLTPPLITIDPTDQTVSVGGTGSFSVTATGGDLSYQWRFNGVAMAGRTGSTLQLLNVQSVNVGIYDVVVKNASGTVISADAALSLASSLRITNHPADCTNDVGSNASFSVIATGPGGLSYQWSKDGVSIPNAKSPFLVVPVTGASAAGAYRVTVTSGSRSVTSRAAVLRVTDYGTLVYKLTGTGTSVQGLRATAKAITGIMVVDRLNQRGGFIWFGNDGLINTLRIEISENLHTHSPGPISKSQTLMNRIDFHGASPETSWNILWLRGSDSLLSISATDRTMGPLTLSGILNHLDLDEDISIQGLTLTATLDIPTSAQARSSTESVEGTLNRLAAGLQLKGFVRK